MDDFLKLVTTVLLTSTTVALANTTQATETIASRVSEVDGLQLHYLTAGHGPALILLHGYAETSLMWRPIIPVLAERFTVIAPDLPGIGDSGIPADGSGYEECRRPHSWPGQVPGRAES